jgi:Tfp pilus assembly protein PilO
MARTTSFTKRSLINKANSTMVIATTIAAFVLVFTLVAGRSLISQMMYQNKVIGVKKTALKQLEADLAARDTLAQSYSDFVSTTPNVLGGERTGKGDKDGDNAKLVLDSLPSRYDFPALTTSLEKIIIGQNLSILGISGTDEEADQETKQTSPDPAPVDMPFQVQVSGSYTSIQSLVDVLLHSIRPFQIQTIELSGNESSMTASIAAKTFYQPEKNLDITKEVVR